jgi:cytochrome c-type protein NapB
VPHAIDQIGVPACLACHDRGMQVGALIARPMSHEPRASCVQCHVVSEDPRPGVITPPPPVNTFVGLAAPNGGERAWDGAPPTIPHATRMRERCDSCHGVLGVVGMRSTHPWRASCTQCHAPSAALDQRAPAEVSP